MSISRHRRVPATPTTVAESLFLPGPGFLCLCRNWPVFKVSKASGPCLQCNGQGPLASSRDGRRPSVPVKTL